MSLVWVKAGQCNQETTIEARRTDMTHVAVEFATTCEHVQELAEVLKMLDIAREMSVPLLDTAVYRLANEHVCRNSCIVPAAVFKALEVEANIFPPPKARSCLWTAQEGERCAGADRENGPYAAVTCADMALAANVRCQTGMEPRDRFPKSYFLTKGVPCFT